MSFEGTDNEILMPLRFLNVSCVAKYGVLSPCTGKTKHNLKN